MVGWGPGPTASREPKPPRRQQRGAVDARSGPRRTLASPRRQQRAVLELGRPAHDGPS